MNPVTARQGWSEWQPLEGMPAVSADVFAEILDGGQAFRWRRIESDGQAPLHARPVDNIRANPTWEGVWANNIAHLRINHDGRIQWSAPLGIQAQVGVNLGGYFAIARDFAALPDTLPWRSDSHLARCMDAFPGLRILRQPFGETLLGFLCSATKQIVQIKQMVALLAHRHGTPILNRAAADACATSDAAATGRFRRLPTWGELARVPESDLRQCLLGFRARFIAETARFLAARPGWLGETEALPYPAAKARLRLLPGVGEKIADCVLLYGAGRLEAFPVDVWILKTMARRYALEGWKPEPLTQFGRVHFGPFAGLAQQYLFAWERRFGKTESSGVQGRAGLPRPILKTSHRTRAKQ
ncbi:MAG: DNA glycosylase [Opitutus sp.]